MTNNIVERRSKAPSSGWLQQASTTGWGKDYEKHQGYEQYTDT